MAEPLVAVRGLSIGYRDALGALTMAVREASFELPAGGSLGIVGESGSGKSTVARALLGHYRGGSERTAGEIVVAGRPVSSATREQLASRRGVEMAFVPQNPLSSLTHHIRVGPQLVEILHTRAGLSSSAARERALALFAATQLPDPQTLFDRFPHQLSGGQRQRVVIACALACRPRLLVLDEPTTALDKTTEVQVLDLVQALRAEIGAGLVLVTHDLNVVASVCDRVVVMKDGCVVEQGPTADTFRAPATAYTRELVGSVLRLEDEPPQAQWTGGSPAASLNEPRNEPSNEPSNGPLEASATAAPAEAGAPVLELQDLQHRYRRASWFGGGAREARPALAEVSLQLAAGEILGIIGESGSGKSTLGGIVAGLIPPSQGRLQFQGQALGAGAASRTREQRRRIQMIFQDPLSSLNPRQTVATAIARPIRMFFGVTAAEARRRAAALLAELGMGPEYLDRFPRQLSGGQQQRVAIARAFAAEPDLIVCDEVTSALDATVQGQVLAALRQMQQRRGVAMMVITHDLAVVWRLAQRVLVLREGVVHEEGATRQVFADPRSPYTRALLEASTRASRLGPQGCT